MKNYSMEKFIHKYGLVNTDKGSCVTQCIVESFSSEQENRFHLTTSKKINKQKKWRERAESCWKLIIHRSRIVKKTIVKIMRKVCERESSPILKLLIVFRFLFRNRAVVFWAWKLICAENENHKLRGRKQSFETGCAASHQFERILTRVVEMEIKLK